jgi:hypothetical protein
MQKQGRAAGKAERGILFFFLNLDVCVRLFFYFLFFFYLF